MLDAHSLLLTSSPPSTAIVLGSGLGSIAERVQAVQAVPFAALPELGATHVQGHAGHIILGDWAGRRVLLFSGRLHRYEGNTWERVLTPIRMAAEWGVRRLVLTNAAGGIRDDLTPGCLMAIRGHFDFTGAGLAAELQETPYSQRLLASLRSAARAIDTDLRVGTYAAMLGPNYETPAEIRSLRSLGADAVGMSTAHEIALAHQLGLECAAVSCITNRAAGLSDTRLTHEEVLENSRKQARRLGELLQRFVIESEPVA